MRECAPPGRHRATPGMILIPGEGGDNLLRGSLLEFRHEADGIRSGLGLNQPVKMARHQHPARQEEPGFPADRMQSFAKGPAEPLTRKLADAAIVAGGGPAQNVVLRFTWIELMPNSATTTDSFAVRQPAIK